MLHPTLKCLILGLLLAAALAGCSAPQTPESQVRAVLDRMESAIEARDVGDFKTGLSTQYQDREGRDARELAKRVHGYFLMNQSIHLLTRVNRIDFPTTEEATVAISVAMVGKEADNASAWNLAAEAHDFDITLRNEEGNWRVTYAEMRRPP